MTTKIQKVSLKSLQADVNLFKDEFEATKKELIDVKKELKLVKEEVRLLKENEFENSRSTKRKSEENVMCKICEKSLSSKKNLKIHNLEYHKRQIKCKTCPESFEKNCDLEVHIKMQHGSEEPFKCDVCDKCFSLEWRLKKHENMHKSNENKFCHYYNNQKDCPYEDLGCMFLHEESTVCRFQANCGNKLCQFRHRDVFKCEYCEYTNQTEKELVVHMDDDHDEWKVTEYFCNNFCRAEHAIHICMTSDDFKEFRGFDIIKTKFDDYIEDSIFACLECKFTAKNKEKMKEHMKSSHADKTFIKCTFCDSRYSEWRELRKHFKDNHMEPYED